MTFTGTVGTICMFPLRAVIRISVALGISPNTLTLVGVLINCVAGSLSQVLISTAPLEGAVQRHHTERWPWPNLDVFVLASRRERLSTW